MDFRNSQFEVDSGKISQEELTEKILNLPCVYGIFQTYAEIFCLEVNNKQTDSQITVALLYSHLNLAIEATNAFQIPNNWFIAHWSDIDDSLQACIDLEIDAVAFDSLPKNDTLTGLVIDKTSLKEVISMI